MCILIYLRRLIKIHWFRLIMLIWGINLFIWIDFILEKIYIFWENWIFILLNSIAIKLICLFNLCFDNALFITLGINATGLAFALNIHIFLNCIIALYFFKWFINILSFYKFYVGKAKSYLIFWFLWNWLIIYFLLLILVCTKHV